MASVTPKKTRNLVPKDDLSQEAVNNDDCLYTTHLHLRPVLRALRLQLIASVGLGLPKHGGGIHVSVGKLYYRISALLSQQWGGGIPDNNKAMFQD